MGRRHRRQSNIKPSNTNDVVGEYARATRRRPPRRRRGESRLSCLSRSTPQERYDALNKVSVEILSRKESSAPAAREEGRPCRRHGEVARAGQIFAFFAGEALDEREKALGAAGPRCRDHARALGVVADHAEGISRSDSRLEDKRPPLCHGNTVVFRPPNWCRLRACALGDHRAGGLSAACSISSSLSSVSARPCWKSRMSAAISFTGSVATGARSPRLRAVEPMKKFQLEMAARIRWSCSTTRPQGPVEVAVNGAYFSTASAARRRRG